MIILLERKIFTIQESPSVALPRVTKSSRGEGTLDFKEKQNCFLNDSISARIKDSTTVSRRWEITGSLFTLARFSKSTEPLVSWMGGLKWEKCLWISRCPLSELNRQDYRSCKRMDFHQGN